MAIGEFEVTFVGRGQSSRVSVLARARPEVGVARDAVDLPLSRDVVTGASDFASAGAALSRNLDVWTGRWRTERASDPVHRVLGERLGSFVMPKNVRALWQRFRGARGDGPVRLLLRFDPEDESVGWLAALPWELVCLEPGKPLLQQRGVSLVRFLESAELVRPRPWGAAPSVLAMGSNPGASQRLSLDEERAWIEKAWSAVADARVRVLMGATRETLGREMTKDWTVFHFMGHGAYDSSTDRGALLMSRQGTEPDKVEAAALAAALGGVGGPRLVVLNSCSSGASPLLGDDSAAALGSVGAALVRAGTPTVVAMRSAIGDRQAVRFSQALHRSLAAGDPADFAVCEGRLAMFLADPEGLDWSTPILFSSSAALEQPSGAEARAARGVRTRGGDLLIEARKKFKVGTQVFGRAAPRGVTLRAESWEVDSQVFGEGRATPADEAPDEDETGASKGRTDRGSNDGT